MDSMFCHSVLEINLNYCLLRSWKIKNRLYFTSSNIIAKCFHVLNADDHNKNYKISDLQTVKTANKNLDSLFNFKRYPSTLYPNVTYLHHLLAAIKW